MHRPIGTAEGALPKLVARLIESERRPLSAWEAASRLHARSSDVAAVLDEMIAEGRLARFRAGLSRYYAEPRAALVEKRPLLGRVIADNIKGLFMVPGTWLAWRFHAEAIRLQTVNG